MMEPTQTVESLKMEVGELRSAMATVTEALILFQEFIEREIGEMSYFRDSGSYEKLVKTLNKIRVQASRVAGPHVMLKQKNLHSIEMDSRSNYDIDEDEQVEVDVDYNDDDPVDEITIRQVYSVPSPEKDSVDSFVKANNTAITITPVYQEEEKKREQQQQPFLFPKSTVMMMDKNGSPQFVSTDSPFMVVDNQRIVSSVKLAENPTKINNNGNLGSMFSMIPIPVAMPLPALAPVLATPKKSKKSEKKVAKKKSLLKINNSVKQKAAKKAPNGIPEPGLLSNLGNNQVSGADVPLNLKKKVKNTKRAQNTVSCGFCGKSYSSKGVMSRHIKEAHKAEPQFPCFYCPQKFRTGPARLEHMNSVHPEDMNSGVCPYCKRESGSITGKRNHMMLCARKFRVALGVVPASVNVSATSPTEPGMK